jgi:hypothetical protein
MVRRRRSVEFGLAGKAGRHVLRIGRAGKVNAAWRTGRESGEDRQVRRSILRHERDGMFR